MIAVLEITNIIPKIFYKVMYKKYSYIFINKATKVAWLSAALIFSSLGLSAQTFPIQVTTTLTRPYSPYLTDYTQPGADRFRTTIFLSDLTQTNYPVRLQLRIEGITTEVVIQTNPNYIPAPIFLQGGVPEILTSDDLAAYFRPENLQFTGISSNVVLSRAALPEGLYRFCFTVLDYNRGVAVSAPGCGNAWLVLNDPPLINLPRNEQKVTTQEPQFLRFQWTPRHTSSPNSATAVEYDFRLVQMNPPERNPNDAVLSQLPLYETTTMATNVLMGPAEPPLIPGAKYAFRVRARDIQGNDIFRNQGYSEAVTFTYGEACTPPILDAKSIAPDALQFTWQPLPQQSDFRLRFRKQSLNNDLPWQERPTATSLLQVDKLEPNTLYEYQINATCGSFVGDYSPLDTVRSQQLPRSGNEACGAAPAEWRLDNRAPLPALNVGDVVKAGDFDVKVDSVSGANGSYTGKGRIVVPFMNNIKIQVMFTRATVNTEYRLVDGIMNVTGFKGQLIDSDLRAKLTDALNTADDALAMASTGGVGLLLPVLDKLAPEIDKALQWPLPDSIRLELRAAKVAIAEARKAIKDGNQDVAKAKVKQVKDALSKAGKAAGGAIAQTVKNAAKAAKKILDIIKKALRNNRAESDSVRSKREEQKGPAIAATNAVSDSITVLREKVPGIGQGSSEGLGSVVQMSGDEVSFEAPEEANQQPLYASYSKRRKTADEIIADIKIYLGVALYVQQVLTDPQKLNTLRTEIERDLRQKANEFLQQALNGKTDELEKFLRSYLREKIKAVVSKGEGLLSQRIDALKAQLQQADQKQEPADASDEEDGLPELPKDGLDDGIPPGMPPMDSPPVGAPPAPQPPKPNGNGG